MGLWGAAGGSFYWQLGCHIGSTRLLIKITNNKTPFQLSTYISPKTMYLTQIGHVEWIQHLYKVGKRPHEMWVAFCFDLWAFLSSFVAFLFLHPTARADSVRATAIAIANSKGRDMREETKKETFIIIFQDKTIKPSLRSFSPLVPSSLFRMTPAALWMKAYHKTFII